MLSRPSSGVRQHCTAPRRCLAAPGADSGDPWGLESLLAGALLPFFVCVCVCVHNPTPFFDCATSSVSSRRATDMPRLYDFRCAVPVPSMAPHTGRRCSAVCIVVVALTALWTNSAFCPGHKEVPSSERVPSPTRGSQLPRPRLGFKRPGGSLESSRLLGRVSRAAEDKGFAGMKNILRVQAVGSGRGSFILEMGGIRILVNPNLQGSDLKPENVHEEFDYVFLSSEEPEFFHRPTVDKMKLTKVKFVTSQKAGQELAKMMVRNLAVLQNGPGGQCCSDLHSDSSARSARFQPAGTTQYPNHNMLTP